MAVHRLLKFLIGPQFLQRSWRRTPRAHCSNGGTSESIRLSKLATARSYLEKRGCRSGKKGSVPRPSRKVWSAPKHAEFSSCRESFHVAVVRTTQLDFGSGEPLDDLHGSTTLGTAIKIGGVFGGRRVLFGRRLLCRTQQLKAKGQGRGASPVGQEAEVSDAYETLRKQVQQKSA